MPDDTELSAPARVSRTIPFRPYDGHLLLRMGGADVLLDTGAPVTVGRSEDWSFLGQPARIATTFIGVDLGELSRLVGTGIDVLLGADLLQRFVVDIDPAASVVRFADWAPRGAEYPMELLMGVPVATLPLAGRERRLFLDTGAKLPYLCEEPPGYPVAGTVEDFYPTFGRFTSPLFQVPLEIGGAQLELAAGVLPAAVAAMLRFTGTEGILGMSILEHFRLAFDYPRRCVVFAPRGS